MRIINSNDIAEVVKGMCIKANCHINKDIKSALSNSVKTEKSDISKGVIENLLKNAEIADSKEVPICQDTGMAVFFIEIGNEVFVEGDTITDAVNKGVSMGYTDGYLRKSVVRDPLDRVNTKDNTPAVIYYDFVKGDKIKITFAPKGFGSENKGGVKMLNPSDGVDGVIDFVVETVRKAGANPCPPMVVGVGIGGSIRTALNCKAAVRQSIYHPIEKRKQFVKNLRAGDFLLFLVGQGLVGVIGRLQVGIDRILFLLTHSGQRLRRGKFVNQFLHILRG